MTKMKRSIAFIFSILILSSMLCGCGSQRELNTLVIVMGMGIDTDTNQPNNVKLIAQIVKPNKIKGASSESSGPGTSQQAYYNLDSSASNSFEAIREFTHETNNKLYIAHTQVIVIGRDMAMRGIQAPLDFFLKAKETRPTTNIVISSTSAADILDVMPQLDMLPAIHINKLVKAQEANSQSREVNIQQFTNIMLSKASSLVVPLISVVQAGEDKELSVKGMAVFKGDKMVGEINEKETRGLLWVKGWIASGAINVDIDDGQGSMEITSSNSELSPAVKDGKVTMKLKISVDSVLSTQTCHKNLATPEGFKELEKLQSEEIKTEILASLAKAQDMGTDIFDFGEELHKFDASAWKDMKDNWQAVFPTVQMDIEIESHIRAAGVIIKPALPESMEDQ